jgi:intein/homing endonuclease
LLTDGTFIKINDWCNNYSNLKLDLVSFDEKRQEFVKGIGHSPRVGQITNEEIEIELENGEIFKCTANHPFLTKRGWVNAEDLNDEDDIMDIGYHGDKK